MLNEIKLLTKIQICNYFGFNEALHSKDGSKKRKLYTAIFAMLIFGIFLCIQTGGSVYFLITLGVSELIPSMVGATVSGLSLMLTFFKAGATLFNLKSYEKTVTLPIRVSSVVISRFLNLYLFNMFFNIASVGSAVVICLIYSKQTLYFYLTMFIGLLILPLIPIAISVILGSIGYYLASKVQKKNIVSIIWQIGLVVGILYISASTGNTTTEEMTLQLANQIISIGKYYPMLVWFSEGVNGNILQYLLFLLISITITAIMVLLISKFYKKICVGLTSSSSKRNYKLKEQTIRSVFKTLYLREIKRYFASAAYVTNTILGFIFAVVLGIILPFIGIETIFESIGLPYGMLSRALPVLIGLICNTMPITAASISLEGKNFWLLQSLPLNMKQISLAKILLNLTFALPATIIASTGISIALKAGIIEIIFNFTIPIALVLLGSIIGLYMNILNPMMEWESDIVPVKQSKSAMYTMFSLFLSEIVTMILLFAVPDNMLIIAKVVIVIIFTLVSIIIFNIISKTDIKKIK
ncbi:MAG: hypothetical protein IJE40_01000 [Clostridia bacterium]|nr:hypothetical protein [Clostridia bacterium]